MTESLLTRIIVPISNKADTTATCEALPHHLDESVELVEILYVIEQTEGYMDTASPEALQQEAERLFEVAIKRLGADVPVETTTRYGTDSVEEVVTAAEERDATAIVFKPKSKHRLTRLITSDDEHRLLTESPCPVIAVHGPEEDALTEVSK